MDKAMHSAGVLSVPQQSCPAISSQAGLHLESLKNQTTKLFLEILFPLNTLNGVIFCWNQVDF